LDEIINRINIEKFGNSIITL